MSEPINPEIAALHSRLDDLAQENKELSARFDDLAKAHETLVEEVANLRENLKDHVADNDGENKKLVFAQEEIVSRIEALSAAASDTGLPDAALNFDYDHADYVLNKYYHNDRG